MVCANLIFHFFRSESVERDGTAFFAQQGLDEEYGAGEGQGVSCFVYTWDEKVILMKKNVPWPALGFFGTSWW